MTRDESAPEKNLDHKNCHSGPYWREYRAFQRYISGNRMLAQDVLVLGLKALLELLEMLLRYIPGPIGFKLRYYYYKLFLKEIGKNVLIDVGVIIAGPGNVSLGDYTWIDAYSMIHAFLGEVSIGKRVHVAPYSLIASRSPVVIEDFVGISSAVKIYSNSEYPAEGKYMSGPMVPEQVKAFRSAPVTLRKNCFIGANSVILPGVDVGEGAVVGAGAVITRSVAPYAIVVGAGRIIGKRDKVVIPDL